MALVALTFLNHYAHKLKYLHKTIIKFSQTIKQFSKNANQDLFKFFLNHKNWKRI